MWVKFLILKEKIDWSDARSALSRSSISARLPQPTQRFADADGIRGIVACRAFRYHQQGSKLLFPCLEAPTSSSR